METWDFRLSYGVKSANHCSFKRRDSYYMYMYETNRHDEAALTATLSESWVSYLLQLIMTSSGMILFFNMPCLGWSPRPRNRPGGSILKLPIFSLWPSIVQKPYSFWISSFFNFSAYKKEIHKMLTCSSFA